VDHLGPVLLRAVDELEGDAFLRGREQTLSELQVPGFVQATGGTGLRGGSAALCARQTVSVGGNAIARTVGRRGGTGGQTDSCDAGAQGQRGEQSAGHSSPREWGE